MFVWVCMCMCMCLMCVGMCVPRCACQGRGQLMSVGPFYYIGPQESTHIFRIFVKHFDRELSECLEELTPVFLVDQ